MNGTTMRCGGKYGDTPSRSRLPSGILFEGLSRYPLECPICRMRPTSYSSIPRRIFSSSNIRV